MRRSTAAGEGIRCRLPDVVGRTLSVPPPTLVLAVAAERSLFFFQAEDGIRDKLVTGVQTCALPIYASTVARMVERQGGRAQVWRARAAHSCAPPRARSQAANPHRPGAGRLRDRLAPRRSRNRASA